MRLYLISFLAGISLYSADNIRSALKAYEKKDLWKVEEVLLKTIEKETFAPGAYYLFSVLYSDENFDRYNLDTAYVFINRSLSLYDSIDDKEKDRLLRQGVADTTLYNQKLRNQRLAFTQAVTENRVEDFDHFLSFYEGSPFEEKAILKRDSLAFQQAKKLHDYNTYKAYMDEYPESESFQEAEKLYERLLYENKTAGGKLQSYISFLDEYPGTFHYQEATSEIASIAFSENSARVFDWFVSNYPDSEKTSLARALLYHRLKGTEDIINFYEKRYIGIATRDSLISLDRLNQKQLHAYLENGLYGLMESNGEVFAEPQFSSIQKNLLCSPLLGEIFLAENQNQVQLLNRDLTAVFKGEITDFDDQGAGWLNIRAENEEIMVHKSGQLILQNDFEEASFLDPFVRYRQNGKYGLISVTGKPLMENEFDSIYAAGPFLIFEKNSQLAFSNSRELLKAADGEEVEISLNYEELELISENYLLTFQEEKEALFDQDLGVKISPLEHEIYDLGNLWLIREDEGYKILNEDFGEVFQEYFEKVFYSDSSYTVRKDSLWYYARVNEPGFLIAFDSVKLLNNEFEFFKIRDSAYVLMDTVSVRIKEDDRLRIVRSANEKDGDFLLVESDDGNTSLYNSSGDMILEGKLDNIFNMSESLFVFERNDRKGVMDTSGMVIVPPEYEIIDTFKFDNASLFNKGKFGNYNYQEKELLKPTYDSRLDPVSDTVLIACEDDKCGLIDIYDNVLLPLDFYSINMLNDTIVMAEQDSGFELIDWKNDTTLLTGFESSTSFQTDSLHFLIETGTGKGVFSPSRGLLIPASFSEIRNIGTGGTPLFLGEMYIPEASFYIALYYDLAGRLIQKQVVEEEDYDKVFCLD